MTNSNNKNNKTSKKTKKKVDNMQESQKKNKIYSILTGASAGFINGLFGGGGGMIVVPMLIKLLGREQKKAHATAILIILPLSILSGLLYASSGAFNLKVGFPVILGVVGGGIIGALALKKLSNQWVLIIFSVLMAGAGLKMLLF